MLRILCVSQDIPDLGDQARYFSASFADGACMSGSNFPVLIIRYTPRYEVQAYHISGRKCTGFNGEVLHRSTPDVRHVAIIDD